MNYQHDFNTNGFLPAITIFTKEEITDIQNKVFSILDEYDILNNEYRCKSHLLFKCIDEIVHHPKILDIVRQLIGSNIICHDTMFWGKKPGTQQFVSFHQDGYYWNAKEPIKGVTVWLPFQDTNELNGTIHYVDKSHGRFCNHTDNVNNDNMLRRGQTVNIQELDLPVIPCNTTSGQVTMHHPYTVHGSYPNNSDKIRLACNIQYIASDHELLIDKYTEYGVLVSGENQSKMQMISRPDTDFKKNYDTWYKAWHNQRQNYLMHQGR